MDRIFTLDEARALLPGIIAEAREIVAGRADLAEIAFDRQAAGGSRLGGLPEIKAIEARIEETLTRWSEQGIEVKGVAPLLIDFPSVLGGASVRLCWIEGEPELAWYHRTDLGFAGRRPLP
ncbi:DUF2203 domain-containing protein [Nonomuraea sp. NPDC050227]|uniref:DUF2203 domain-containing protein n=1 Tax=unclassified Nonomuraea TaxID=2593643 RepID=UPI0036CE4F55